MSRSLIRCCACAASSTRSYRRIPTTWNRSAPVLQFDLSKYKFVEELEVVVGLDSRPDLLAFKPVEFEHLIRRLFEAIGMKSWVTQASRDDGIDAVAVNEDPIVWWLVRHPGQALQQDRAARGRPSLGRRDGGQGGSQGGAGHHLMGGEGQP
jgi:hypothetical protein